MDILHNMKIYKLCGKTIKKDLIVIGIPTNNFKQEPGDNASIKKFCETNFGVDFLMSNKIDVIGKNAHPFYQWAKKVMDWELFLSGIFIKL